MKGLLKSLLISVLLATSISATAGKGHLGFTVHYTLERSAFSARLDRVVVTKVNENSPAKRAGLQPGDVIELSVDGIGRLRNPVIAAPALPTLPNRS